MALTLTLIYRLALLFKKKPLTYIQELNIVKTKLTVMHLFDEHYELVFISFQMALLHPGVFHMACLFRL